MRWLLLILLPGLAYAQFITPPGGVTPEELGSMAYEDKDDYVDRRELVDPVFWIDNQPNAPWTDFELKASDTNFTGGYAADAATYWYHSPDPAKTTVTNQVWSIQPDVFFTDSQRPLDWRVWIRQAGNASIYGMLESSENSYVGGWMIYVRGLELTRAQLENLVWSYMLLDGGTTEEDPGGNPIWRPVRPVDFVPAGIGPYDPVIHHQGNL